MATEGTAISNEAAATPAEAIEHHEAPSGKVGRLVAQAGAGAAEEPQLLDSATGAPVKGAETTPLTPPMPATISADASNVVHLPAGASIEKIKVVGTDIVLEQPDGSTITVQNAALKVPTFVIGDAEIPRETLVAVLGENGINVAAGPDGSISVVSNQSSGGNFSDADGGIGQAGPVIDLLAPTELQFPALEATELLPFAVDPNDNPTIIPDGNSDPSGVFASDRQLDEAGLADGSRAGDGSALVNGVLAISDPDGPGDIASLTINGQTFAIGNLVGQSVAGQFGVLTITSYDPVTGVAQYTYELTSPVTSSGVNPGANVEQDRDIFNLTVTDKDGATGTATLRVDVVDDVPVIDTSKIAVPAALTVDETTLGDNASFTVASVFPAATLSTGADGGSVSYALQLSTNNVGSGLYAHGVNGAQGAQILLSQDPDTGVITGTANGATYFTITLANGEVTLDQLKAIWHGDSPSNYNETASLTLTGASLQLVATVTDGDKDVATDTVDLGGGLIKFEDDGPSASLELVSQPKICSRRRARRSARTTKARRRPIRWRS
ncbi:DUF5801 repeats-in-toxin domain-containing protein [Ensifer sp. LC54]|uniref:DUF5801 repeats-in-toxin domain-containing protein n=1 Tax=Ensifer sp. LC54 TaxID=1873715 RepID=UPI0008134725|nr:DUF5801 repeats-in-toxin domain-containing protein [Ensifer sp. LC54]OCP25131.1 hypothetical protein BC361_18915 [Ensifer sp. LC54]